MIEPRSLYFKQEKARIVEVACALADARGLSYVTRETVAAAVGCAPGNISYYLNMPDLLDAMWRRRCVK